MDDNIILFPQDEAKGKIVDMLIECYRIAGDAGLDITNVSIVCAAMAQRLEALKDVYPDP